MRREFIQSLKWMNPYLPILLDQSKIKLEAKFGPSDYMKEALKNLGSFLSAIEQQSLLNILFGGMFIMFIAKIPH